MIDHISQLTSDPRNARRHTPRNVGTIVDALNEVGAARSIVIDENGIILAGNATIDAAAQAGIERVQVVDADGETIIAVRRTGLTDKQKKRLALFDNRAAELAEWELPVLLEEPDLLAGMFRDDEIAALLASLDEPQVAGDGGDEFDSAPADGPTRTSYGELWRIGDHRLLVGDSTKADDVARLMGGERASACFTSPPYADQREYNGQADLSPQHLAGFIGAVTPYCELLAVNLGISRKDGEINTYWDEYISAARECGLKFLSWNIWDRSGFAYTVGQITAMFTIDHEWILVFGRERQSLNKTVKNKHGGEVQAGTNREADGSTRRFHAGATASHRQLGTVIRCDIARGDKGDIDHPASFPVALPEQYIEALTGRGDTVYDPFLGSGTTLIAAHRTGRKCYGMEIEPKYADVILRRAEAEGISPIERVG
jgi:DNA modification methylase